MQDNLEKHTHLCAEELHAIRLFKLKELEKVWNELLVIGTVPSLYERHSEYVDYKPFEEGFRASSKVIFEERKHIIEKIKSEIGDIYYENEANIGIKGINKDEIVILEILLSLDYTPPQDFKILPNIYYY